MRVWNPTSPRSPMRLSLSLTVLLVTLMTSSDGISVPNIRGWRATDVHDHKRIEGRDAIVQSVTNIQECLRLCWRLTFCKAVTYTRVTATSCSVSPHFPSAIDELTDDVTSAVIDMREASLDKPRMYGCDKRPCLETEICVTVKVKSHHLCLSLGTASCGEPPTVNNTIVTKDGFSRAFYSCIPGYVPRAPNSMTSTCDRASGTWSNVEGKCELFTCGVPPSVIKATVHYTDTVATYTCLEGHRSNGQLQMNISCQADGLWTQTPEPCVPVDCGQPTQVPNGLLTFPNATPSLSSTANTQMTSGMTVAGGDTGYGAIAEYSCKTGYVSDPETLTSICQADGQWSTDSSLECTPVDCGQPGEKELTDLIYNETTYLSFVEYKCIMGYNIKDDDSVATSVCLPTGSWSPTNISCQPVDCHRPQGHPGIKLSFNQTTFGSKVQISCQETGKFWTGKNEFQVCQASGEWSSAVGYCAEVSCGPAPDMSNADVEVSKLDDGTGFKATYTCHLGYRLDDTATAHTLNCLTGDDSWEGDLQASCHVVSCGQPPEVPNAEVRTDGGVSYLAQAVYTCFHGYEFATPYHSRTCNETGTWSQEEISCQEKQCGPAPNVISARSLSHRKSDFAIGDSVSYECRGRLTISLSPNEIFCGDGGWENTSDVYCLDVTCQEPPRVKNSTRKISRSEPFTVTYTCDEGFRLKDPGFSSLTCTNNEWQTKSQKLLCIPEGCGAPPEIEGASVSYNSTSVGAEANYTCERGFLLANPSHNKRLCSVDNNWTDEDVVCKPIDCDDPPKVENAVASFNSTLYNSVAIYTCKAWFETLDGVNSRRCTEDAEWSYEFIECKPIGNASCPEPPKVENASVDYHSRLSGAVVHYRCHFGFEHSWFETKTCTPDGTWTTEKIVCEEVDCGPPPVVSHADTQTKGTTHGAVVAYRCVEGYEFKTQFNSQVCLGNGHWSDELIECGDPQEISCPQPPEVPNAVVKAHSVLTGGVVSYECEDGFELIPRETTPLFDIRKASLECVKGAWSGEAIQCMPKDCGLPLDVLGTSLDYTSTVFGSTVEYACQFRTRQVGYSKRVCQADGQWSREVIQCLSLRESFCEEPPPMIAGTIVNYTSHLFGTEAVYICPKGYVGGGRYTCSSHGDWIVRERVRCQPILCPDTPLVPLTNRENQTNQYGNIAVYTCMVTLDSLDYHPVRSRCLANGSWSYVTHPCQMCFGQPPEVENAAKINSSGYFGGKAFYSCLPGFEPESDKALERTCLETTRWSSEESGCLPVDCGDPPEVEALQILKVENTTYESVAWYGCQRNMNLNQTSVCQANATWSPVDVVCPLCDLNTDIARGRLIPSSTKNRNRAPSQQSITEAQVECDEWSRLFLLNGRQDDVMQCKQGDDGEIFWEGLKDFFCLQVLWLSYPPVNFATQVIVQEDTELFEACWKGTAHTRFQIGLTAFKPDSSVSTRAFSASFNKIRRSTNTCHLSLTQTPYGGVTVTKQKYDVPFTVGSPSTVCVRLNMASVLYTVVLNGSEVESMGDVQIDPTELRFLVIEGVGLQFNSVELKFTDVVDRSGDETETTSSPTQSQTSESESDSHPTTESQSRKDGNGQVVVHEGVIPFPA